MIAKRRIASSETPPIGSTWTAEPARRETSGITLTFTPASRRARITNMSSSPPLEPGATITRSISSSSSSRLRYLAAAVRARSSSRSVRRRRARRARASLISIAPRRVGSRLGVADQQAALGRNAGAPDPARGRPQSPRDRRTGRPAAAGPRRSRSSSPMKLRRHRGRGRGPSLLPRRTGPGPRRGWSCGSSARRGRTGRAVSCSSRGVHRHDHDRGLERARAEGDREDPEGEAEASTSASGEQPPEVAVAPTVAPDPVRLDRRARPARGLRDCSPAAVGSGKRVSRRCRASMRASARAAQPWGGIVAAAGCRVTGFGAGAGPSAADSALPATVSRLPLVRSSVGGSSWIEPRIFASASSPRYDCAPIITSPRSDFAGSPPRLPHRHPGRVPELSRPVSTGGPVRSVRRVSREPLLETPGSGADGVAAALRIAASGTSCGGCLAPVAGR